MTRYASDLLIVAGGLIVLGGVYLLAGVAVAMILAGLAMLTIGMQAARRELEGGR